VKQLQQLLLRISRSTLKTSIPGAGSQPNNGQRKTDCSNRYYSPFIFLHYAAKTPDGLQRHDNLAEWTGLEPATPGVTGRYSNQLNYHSWQAAFRLRLSTQAKRYNLATLRGFEPRYSP
jgi:hypothetical protein